MSGYKTAVVGVGATGSVLAAALLKSDPEAILVDPRSDLQENLKRNGLRISGAVSYDVPVKNFFGSIGEIKDAGAEVIFLATKTYHLSRVLDELRGIYRPGMKIVSTHNGLGTEDVIAEAFGADSAFRMSLNFGVSIKGPGETEAAFFNKPNHLGALTRDNREAGQKIAQLFTDSGLDTEYVDDIKLYVWKKMIMKCTMASICAVADKTIKEALDFPPTREIADGCFREVLAVAKAKGYDLGENYLEQALGYLEKVGVHKDSMCWDIANKMRTEIDFLGGKVVEYGEETGVDTPYYRTMANLVKALEDNYLKR